MKRVLFLLLFTTILLGCDDDEKLTGFKFTVLDIADLDGKIDQVVVEFSYRVTYPATGFVTYKNTPIASASIKNKGFTVYLPEYLPEEYVSDETAFSFHDREGLTISNQDVKITRSISFNGYANGVFKGFFICDNVHSNPLVEKGYNVIQLAYSSAASTIAGTNSIFSGGNDELRYTFDLNMRTGYNLFMESTVERNTDLHHLSFTSPASQGDGGTRWRFLRISK